MTFLLLKEDGTAVRKNTNELFNARPVDIESDSVVTAMIHSDEDYGDDPNIRSDYENVVAMRAANMLRRRVYDIHLSQLTSLDLTLDSIDQIIVASPHTANHPEFINTLCDWLHGGGNLWIMLDRVGIEATRQIIGAEFQAEWIDRVPLNEFQVISSMGLSENKKHKPRYFEKPVNFDHIFAEGGETYCEISGWPAIISYKVGRGRVLVSMLESAGMLQPQGPPADNPSTFGRSRPNMTSMLTDYQLVEPFATISTDFLQDRKRSPKNSKLVFASHENEIGHRVPSRGFILIILSAFCFGLGGLGAILWKLESLQNMVWVTPIVTLATAGVLIFSAHSNRTGIPDSLHETRIAQIDRSGEEAEVIGYRSLYTQNGTSTEVQSTQGGWIKLPEKPSRGNFRSFVLRDTNDWMLKKTYFQSGLYHTSYNQNLEFNDTFRATASIEDSRIKGKLKFPPDLKPTDLLMVTPRAHLFGKIDDDGNFEFDLSSQAFVKYIQANILNDRQTKHQEFYKMLLARDAQAKPQDYSLMFWSYSDLGTGMQTASDVKEKCEVLYVLPIEFQRSPPNTIVNLPRQLLPYYSSRGLNGENASNAYDRRKQQCNGNRQRTKVFLRIQLTESLLPIKSESLSMNVAIEAGERSLEVFGFQNANGAKPVETSLKKFESANGKYSIDFDNPQLLDVDENGTILVAIEIGPSKQESEGTNLTMLKIWNVEDVSFSFSGTTLPIDEFTE